MLKKFLATISYVTLPVVTYAQFNGSNAESLFDSARGLVVQRLIPLLVAFALMYVIYSVVQFMAAAGDSQQREEKKQQIFWGLVGLFVITSIWGLVAVIGDTFGLFPGGTLTNQ